MSTVLKLVVAGAVLLSAQSVLAATTEGVSGKVFVSHGGGFGAAANGESVAGGDKVMTRARSAATIVYADGCKVKVEANQTATVAATSPCKAPAVAGDEGAQSFQLSPLVIGGGIAVLGAGAILLIGSSSDKSSSP